MGTHKVTLILMLGLAWAMAFTPVLDEQAMVTRGIENFNHKLFQAVARDTEAGKNFIMSSYGVHMVLSMLSYAAKGETMVQMRRGLELPKPSKIALEGYKKIVAGHQNSENVSLNIASHAYVSQGFTVNPRYQNLIAEKFKARVSKLNMGDSIEAAEIINNWVKEETKNMIQEVMEPGDINPATALILLNAIYFRGGWQTYFKTDYDREFYVNGKSNASVPTMSIKENFLYGQIPLHNAEFVVVPYENNNFKMVIIVPDRIDGLDEIVEGLNNIGHISDLVANATVQKVRLTMPKFKIESTIDFQGALEQLGMTHMFRKSADFSRIASDASSLRVDKIRQRAIIAVTETGTEAAAATMIMAVPLMAADRLIEVTVNRPFLFAILMGDNPLFTGLVKDPREGMTAPPPEMNSTSGSLKNNYDDTIIFPRDD